MANEERTKVLVLGLAALAAWIAAMFVPMIWGIAYMGAVVESVWSVSKLFALIALVVWGVIASVPLWSAAAWPWRVPCGFGVLVIVASLAMAVQFFVAFARNGDGGFHPAGIAVLAVAGSLLLAEGMLAKPRARRHS